MKQVSMKKVCAIALSPLVVCLSAPLGVVNAKNDALSNECKITELLLEELERGEEKIPVYLWYKDIDHSMIEQTVSTKLGFTIDDIENDFDEPNPKLIDIIMQKKKSYLRRNGRKMNDYTVKSV